MLASVKLCLITICLDSCYLYGDEECDAMLNNMGVGWFCIFYLRNGLYKNRCLLLIGRIL